MGGIGAPSATNEAIDIAFVQQHRSNQGQTATHFYLGHLNRDALALLHAMVGLPKVTVAVVVLYIDNLVIEACFQSQTKFFNSFSNDRWAANQGGASQTFVAHDLRGTQNAFFFAFAVGHALFQTAFGCGVDRLHGGARRVHKILQSLAIGFHVSDRSKRHAAVSRRLRNRGRNFDHQTRIEWLGN